MYKPVCTHYTAAYIQHSINTLYCGIFTRQYVLTIMLYMYKTVCTHYTAVYVQDSMYSLYCGICTNDSWFLKCNHASAAAIKIAGLVEGRHVGEAVIKKAGLKMQPCWCGSYQHGCFVEGNHAGGQLSRSLVCGMQPCRWGSCQDIWFVECNHVGEAIIKIAFLWNITVFVWQS